MHRITESDVEQKMVWPLLTRPDFMAIPQDQIATKRFIPRKDIGKGSFAVRGFAPDYLVYSDRVPVFVVEAKAPDESAETGYAEARLYANEINSSYPSGINPIRFVLATNGKKYLFGPVDAQPTLEWEMDNPCAGAEVTQLANQAGWRALREVSAPIAIGLERKRYFNASFLFGGNARLNIRLGRNSLSDVLAPVIRRYFDADTPEEQEEILAKAYIDSDLTTRYAREFEAFLRDRVVPIFVPAGTILEPRRRSEDHFSAALGQYSEALPTSGSLQLLIGAVGAGKTTFVKRFEEFLLPKEVRDRVFWVRIDFNDAPPDPKLYPVWLCERFIDAFKKQFYKGDPNIQLAIFAERKRDFDYAHFLIKESDVHEYNRQLTLQLADWQRDPVIFATSACRYLIGDRAVGIVVVFDNTDRRTRDQQLELFEVAQWFRTETRSCCVLALRDETYERYKEEPPLDSFIHSNHFYIRSPRFIDIVRKRLQLSLEALKAGKLTGSLPGIGRIQIGEQRIAGFLDGLFKQLFTSSKRKMSWVAEGLAGRSARTSLRMFARLIYSPHIDEKHLVRSGQSDGELLIPDWCIANALMKTDYLFFAEDHGFVSNVLDFEADSQTSDNFIRTEILQFMVDQRKKRGDIGIEGYHFAKTVCDRLTHMGYSRRDTLTELTWAVRRGLLVADNFSARPVVESDALKATAAAFVHTNILLNRVEYIANSMLVAKVFDRTVAERVSEIWNIKPPQTDISLARKREITQLTQDYLRLAANQRSKHYPIGDHLAVGARAVEDALVRALVVRDNREHTLFQDSEARH